VLSLLSCAQSPIPFLIQEFLSSQMPIARASNPSYSRGRFQEFKPQYRKKKKKKNFKTFNNLNTSLKHVDKEYLSE
jgi:FMN-dependent NADH-azoreductase